jgi:hypothetical protein
MLVRDPPSKSYSCVAKERSPCKNLVPSSASWQEQSIDYYQIRISDQFEVSVKQCKISSFLILGRKKYGYQEEYIPS